MDERTHLVLFLVILRQKAPQRAALLLRQRQLMPFPYDRVYRKRTRSIGVVFIFYFSRLGRISPPRYFASKNIK